MKYIFIIVTIYASTGNIEKVFAIDRSKVDVYIKSDPSSKINCIDKELIETIDSGISYGGKYGFLSSDSKEELKKKAEINCKQSSDTYIKLLENQLGTHESDIIGIDRTTNEHYGIKCEISNIEEVPGTRKNGNFDFKYKFHASMVIEHRPTPNRIVKKERVISLPGKFSENGAKINNMYLVNQADPVTDTKTKEQSISDLKTQCDRVGGQLTSIEHKKTGSRRGWREESNGWYAQGGAFLDEWLTSAVCKGKLYIYDTPENMVATANKECVNEENSSPPKDRKSFKCKLGDNVYEKISQIASEPLQKISMLVEDNFSYKKEDSKELYEQWHKERVARCKGYQNTDDTEKNVINNLKEITKVKSLGSAPSQVQSVEINNNIKKEKSDFEISKPLDASKAESK